MRALVVDDEKLIVKGLKFNLKVTKWTVLMMARKL